LQKTFFLLFLLLPMQAQAQTDPPLVASGDYQTDAYQWSFAVGDLAILTLQTGNTMWSQGSIQPNLGIVPVQQVDLPDVTILLYPNPTADVLYYQISAPASTKDLRLDVFDAGGRSVYGRAIPVSNLETHRLSLSALPAGPYFIRLTDPQGRLLSKPFQKL
jgi:hypothetical protein